MTQQQRNTLEEFQKVSEEQTIKSARTLLKIDQTLQLLTEKMTDFELKLNYVLLRRTKLKKKEKELKLEENHSIIQKASPKNFINNKIVIFRSTFIIYFVFMIFVILIILSVLANIIIVD